MCHKGCSGTGKGLSNGKHLPREPWGVSHPAIVTCSPWQCCCLRNNGVLWEYWPGGESSFLTFVPSFSQIIHFAQLIHWLSSTSSVRKEPVASSYTCCDLSHRRRFAVSWSSCSDSLTLPPLPGSGCTSPAVFITASCGAQRVRTGWNDVIMGIPPNKTMAEYVVNIGRYVCTLKLSIHSVYICINAEEQG